MALAANDTQWDIIKTEYIVGKCSCQELCEKYDIPARTMQDRCRREGWTKSRKAYRQKLVDNLIKNQAKEDAKHLGSLRSAATSMAGVLEEIAGRVAFVMDGDDGYNADTKSVKDVVTALKDLTATIRDLYGLPNVEEAARIRIAEERLELDRQRYDNGEDDAVIRVIMAGSEEYAE